LDGVVGQENQLQLTNRLARLDVVKVTEHAAVRYHST